MKLTGLTTTATTHSREEKKRKEQCDKMLFNCVAFHFIVHSNSIESSFAPFDFGVNTPILC